MKRALVIAALLGIFAIYFLQSNDKEIVKIAVLKSGRCLQWASEELKNDNFDNDVGDKIDQTIKKTINNNNAINYIYTKSGQTKTLSSGS